MAERVARSIGFGAAALLAGCGGAEETADRGGKAKAQVPAGPVEAAQRLVRRRLRGEVSFGEARAYRSGDVAVVCGTYSEPGAAGRRFVSVSELEVWLEPEMAPGEMDRAFGEFCRDRSANA